ncbi:MAG: AAA family ATPase, partial [Acidobacteriota bacterium]
MFDDITQKEELPAPVDTSEIDNLDLQALRARVRMYVRDNSTSLRAVANAAGVGISTFTAFLGDTYAGNNENIAKMVRAFLKSEMALSKRRLVLPAAQKFVETRSATKFITALEHAQYVPALVAIIGGAGVGKTTTLEHYRTTRPNVWHLTATPMTSSAYAMMEYLREELNVTSTAPHKVGRAIQQRLLGTKGLIIVDEAQHLVVQAIEQMRSVFDLAHIGLAFVGNEEVLSRIDGGSQKANFAQLFSRVGLRVKVPKPSAQDIDLLLDDAGIAEAGQRKLLKWIASRPGA